MSAEITPSSQRLLTLILILLSIPVLYQLYEMFVIEGRVSFATLKSTPLWQYLRLFLNVTIIVLLILRKINILLFTITTSGAECLRLLFNLQYFEELEMKFWIFQLINLTGLILMIVLLKRENKGYFNLEFNTKSNEFENTERLIRKFNLTYLVVLVIEFCIGIGIVVYYGRFEIAYLLNQSFVLTLVVIKLSILGLVRKTKISNLPFMLTISLLINMFLSSSYLIFAPFTKSWDRFNSYEIIYAIIIDCLIITFGILFYFIIKSYFKEKAELDFY